MGGGRKGRRRGLGRPGGAEGGGWEVGRGEEEVKRTAPGRGLEHLRIKFIHFFFHLSSFQGNILFLLHHLLDRATLTASPPIHPPPLLPLPYSPLLVELKIKYVDDKIDFTISCLNGGVSTALNFFLLRLGVGMVV